MTCRQTFSSDFPARDFMGKVKEAEEEEWSRLERCSAAWRSYTGQGKRFSSFSFLFLKEQATQDPLWRTDLCFFHADNAVSWLSPGNCLGSWKGKGWGPRFPVYIEEDSEERLQHTTAGFLHTDLLVINNRRWYLYHKEDEFTHLHFLHSSGWRIFQLW